MSKKYTKQKQKSKLAIRIICFILAFSMFATTFFMLISYLMNM